MKLNIELVTSQAANEWHVAIFEIMFRAISPHLGQCPMKRIRGHGVPPQTLRRFTLSLFSQKWHCALCDGNRCSFGGSKCDYFWQNPYQWLTLQCWRRPVAEPIVV